MAILCRSRSCKDADRRTYARPPSARVCRMNNAAYHRVKWNPVVCRRRSRDFKHIPHAPDGVNELHWKVPVHLRTHTTHQHVDDVCLGIEMVIPDMLEDHRFRDDTPSVAHEIFEQRQLAGLQVEALVSARDLMRE